MKFSSALFVAFATFIASVSSHSTMSFPPPRGHPLNENAAVQDFDCIAAPLNGGSGCAPKKFPCGGYPRDKKIVTTFNAGEVISVKFFNQNFLKLRDQDKQKNQARHNGGLCEFSLSYDGGKTYTVIATYKKTCPDIFFDGWKVKIPDNAPSCDDPGNCIFSWSWINALGNREFYQNCADVKIKGNATEPLPIIDITRANLPPLFKKILTPPGDDLNSGNAIGSGPRKEDVDANLALKIGGGNNKPKNDNKLIPPPQDGNNDQPPQNGNNDQPPQNGNKDQPPQNGNKDQPPQNGNNDQPPQDGNSDQPPQDGNKDQPPQNGNKDQPPQDGNQPPQDGNKDQPPQDGNKDQPPQDGNNDQPPQNGNKDQPPQNGNNDQPPQDGNKDKPQDNQPNNNDDTENGNDQIPCSENGSMVCSKEGSNEFLTCDNGRLVSRSCPGVLVCTQNGKSIFCNLPKRR